MTISVFLSHNTKDKPFVKKLAKDLDSHGVKYWLDDAEIKIGDSLIEKIRNGIDDMDYVAVILSPNSIASSWVQREIDVAMNQEIRRKRVKVLPIMYQKCELPGFLFGKLYADFTDLEKYTTSFEKLVKSMGIVFNRRALENTMTNSSLGKAIDKATNLNLHIFSHPFHRPFQYIGLSIAEVSKAVKQSPNKAGNIIVETDECHLLLESEGNFIQCVDIELKKTAPQYQDREFDSEPILGALSINPAELDLARKQTHYHTYYDHSRKLKIGVSCLYDGAPLNVIFSKKYYGS